MSDWSAGQIVALRAVAEWLRNGTQHQQVFKLFGFAGTGKTVLAKAIDEELVGGQTQFMAPTAKAAQVLRSKGCYNADTYHSLIYNPKEKSKARLRELEAAKARIIANREREKDPKLSLFLDKELDKVLKMLEAESKTANRPAFEVKPESDIRNKPLIALDEGSMVGQDGGADILSFGVPVLVLGDPAQLPPIGSKGFFTQGKPDIMMTEIHRQARDNPIIRLATTVREGGVLRPGDYGKARVITKAQLTPELVVGADQLLCGRNATRRASNRRIRELNQISPGNPFPVQGDKLVCLRNNREAGLWNGATYEQVDCDAQHIDDTVILNVFGCDLGQSYHCDAHAATFLGEDVPWFEKKEREEFDYSYAMTVHKSQGSQWNNVVLFDEWYADSRREWLYTGITRAAENLTVVQFPN